LADFLERWWRSTKIILPIAEKQLICPVYPLGYLLHSLGTNFFQIGELGQPLQFCQVLLQLIHIKRFVKQPIVSLMQGNTMVIDTACCIDLLMEFSVSMRTIELEAVGLHLIHQPLY
ncbi:MAG: hypothetical protein IIV09_03865, partial [Selenomonadaceae bacterium]|nr:hypothetical protein [Selenomonadaceae bacterium]